MNLDNNPDFIRTIVFFRRSITTRPWGSFWTFVQNQKCTVKVISVTKGECLSLQRHKLRDQLYVIIDPIRIQYGLSIESLVTVDAVPFQEFFFVRGMLHRAINNTDKAEARYLEIAFGKYKESDIERLVDKYNRGNG